MRDDDHVRVIGRESDKKIASQDCPTISFGDAVNVEVSSSFSNVLWRVLALEPLRAISEAPPLLGFLYVHGLEVKSSIQYHTKTFVLIFFHGKYIGTP